jgi:hypothetical protein
LVLGDEMKQYTHTYNQNALYFMKLRSLRSKHLAFMPFSEAYVQRANLFQAVRLYVKRFTHA